MLRRPFGTNPQQGREVLGRWRAEPRRSRRLGRRPRVEGLEERRLLSGGITEFPLGESITAVSAITAGPDGNLWVALPSARTIDRITTGGTITEFKLTGPSESGQLVNSITTGPDGNLWFTAAGIGGSIGRITTDGQVTEFPLPLAGSNPLGGGSDPGGIVAGPDGNLWFTETIGGTIDRITPSGKLTVFPTNVSGPDGITVGSDGALWFAGSGEIGRITTDGVVTQFPAPTSGRAIVAGPDGALWFAGSGEIGRITTDGQVAEFAIPSGPSTISAIMAGPDGALWFTEINDNKVGRISTDGSIIEFPLNSTPDNAFGLDNVPSGIATGSDGALWFTEKGTDKVARLDPSINAFYVSGGANLYSPPGTTLNAVVANILDTRPGAGLSDFTATIDWGDGSTSDGTITAQPGGAFEVSGTHVYTSAGNDSISVTVHDGRTGETNTVGTSANIYQLAYFNDPPTTPAELIFVPASPTAAGPQLPSAQHTGILLASGTIAPASASATSTGHTSGPEVLSVTGPQFSNIFETRLLARFQAKNQKAGSSLHARHKLVTHTSFQRATGTRHPH